MKKISIFLKILPVFLGTVIGVGIFGLPFVAQKAGFVPVLLYFFFMVLAAIVIHFFLAEVSLAGKKLHRLPGYVGQYLGRKWENITFIVSALVLLGALLAYLIVGGRFLNSLFAHSLGGNPLIYTFIFWAAASYFVFRGIKSISGVELGFLLFFLLILTGLFFKALPFIRIGNFKGVGWPEIGLPFGVVLFSLWGTDIVPEIKEMVSRYFPKEKVAINLKALLASGLILSVLIYLFFIFIVLGVCGPNTSKEAISGLAGVLGGNSGIIKLSFLFGVICCFTSFITLALTLKKIFWYDLGISKNFSWLLSCFLPLLLFLLGARQFIKILSLTGAVAIGSEAIIVVFLYKGFLRKRLGREMNKAYYSLILVFALGIVFELFYILG